MRHTPIDIWIGSRRSDTGRPPRPHAGSRPGPLTVQCKNPVIRRLCEDRHVLRTHVESALDRRSGAPYYAMQKGRPAPDRYTLRGRRAVDSDSRAGCASKAIRSLHGLTRASRVTATLTCSVATRPVRIATAARRSSAGSNRDWTLRARRARLNRSRRRATCPAVWTDRQSVARQVYIGLQAPRYATLDGNGRQNVDRSQWVTRDQRQRTAADDVTSVGGRFLFFG